jgi:RNA polymerase sigma factor (sigma-70 family)
MQESEFNAIYLPLQAGWYHFALSLVQNRDEAKDIVQEAFVRLWNNRLEIRNPKSYSFRIIKNLCFDHLDRIKKNVSIEQAGNVEDSINTLKNLSMLSDFDLVLQILDTLPLRQRTVMHLKDVEELTYKEISEILAIDENNVRVNLSIARKKVLEIFQKIETI